MDTTTAKELFTYWHENGSAPGLVTNIFLTLNEHDRDFLSPYFTSDRVGDWQNGLELFCNLRIPFYLNVELRSEWGGDSMFIVDSVRMSWDEFEYDGFRNEILTENITIIAY